MPETIAQLTVSFVKHLHTSFLDVLSNCLQVGGDVVDRVGSHLIVEDLPEESARLREIIFWVEWSHLCHESLNDVRFVSGVLVDPVSVGAVVSGVGLVVGACADFDVHGTVSDAVDYVGPIRTVDWNLLEITTQSISMGVRIREQPSLQNSVSGGSHSRHKISR